VCEQRITRTCCPPALVLVEGEAIIDIEGAQPWERGKRGKSEDSALTDKSNELHEIAAIVVITNLPACTQWDDEAIGAVAKQ